jgi:dihydroorotase
MRILIKNAQIVNEGKIFKSDVLIENDLIAKISETIPEENLDKIIDAEGKFLIPGVIDDQVHFREPGLHTKAILKANLKLQLLAELPVL